MDQKNLAALIDHTLLKPEATVGQIDELCAEAKQHQFASVCVNPIWVKRCAEHLKGSGVKVCTVIGFPLGATTPEVKAFETRQAIEHGATEVDMVMNIGAFKSGDLDLVKMDMKAVVEAAGDCVVKVILETGFLSDEEVEIASRKAKEAGAHFVKTSTGFGPGGATVDHIRLMRRIVGDQMGVKASGGVRDRETVHKMVAAGATRIGASSGVAIVAGEAGTSDY
ncbi:deoxyribose-phosphate aldolase [Mechercharimyces sp. CAU 1602]|uniref:deoxyribose-phosphate aldolase n=1 Tax=Mechercharimyces sp. CAU 1602 TaxID=2973933 RepID=UPI0021621482|nr:deoxyribose-phosphate aldolase [Mechercharimyces sp. CAU 1602]MCS1350454.1 deoxyribose-phosphate aldolase [Mechercharimyces sp. CAU 1602]